MASQVPAEDGKVQLRWRETRRCQAMECQCNRTSPAAELTLPCLTCIKVDRPTIAWRNSMIFRQEADEVNAMTMLKVLEVLAQSEKSWEDAAANAVNEAAKSVRGIKSVYIKEMEAVVDNEQITQYRINAKISFMLEGS
ncbi:MAG: dodecin family protein [Kiloniellales bacterium]|nr:dodecin family protein [Kiloniellales bacterium]